MTLLTPSQTTHLHPEDLLDKDPEELTPSERALVDAHLAQCVACRVLVAAEQDFAAELAQMDAPGHASERTAAMLSKAIDTELHPEDLLEREENGEELTAAERAQLDTHLAACMPCRLLRQAQLDFAAELGEDLDAPLPGAREEDAQEDLELARLEAKLHKKPFEKRAATPEKTEKNVIMLRPTWRSRGRVGIALVAAAAVLMMASVAVAARGTRMWAVIFPASVQTEEKAAPAETVAPAPKPKRVSKKAPSHAAPTGQVDTDTSSDDSESPDENVTVPSDVGADLRLPVPAPTACAPVPQQPAPEATPRSANQRPESSVPLIFPSRQTPPGPMFGPYAKTAPPGTSTSSPPSGAALMFSSANDARRRGDHAAAAKAYQELLAQYAGAPEAGAARIALGRMLLDDGDAQGALPMFDQYLNDGGGSLREEAMFGRARAYERLGRSDLEREAWEKLVASYPQSVHTAHAEARIKDLSSR